MSEPRINVYTCRECGGHTVTVDVDEGVTPFMIRCRAGKEVDAADAGILRYNQALEEYGIRIRPRPTVKRGCHGMAYSSFYPRGPKPPHIGEPAWEWYKPTDADLAANYEGDVLEGMREHVGKGGLDLRRRTNRPAIMHAT